MEPHSCNNKRDAYVSIYSTGFGEHPSNFASKPATFPRTEYDMAFGKEFTPTNVPAGSTNNGQWYVAGRDSTDSVCDSRPQTYAFQR